MLGHVALDDAHVLDLGVMLGGHHNGRNRHGRTPLVAHGDLCLAIRAQIGQLARLSHVGEALGKALRKIGGHGHERVGLIGGVAKHHALVARADKVERVDGAGTLGLARVK